MITQEEPTPGYLTERLYLYESEFIYDVTTVEQDHHGRQTEVRWYREIDSLEDS